jgi:uncharacterized membrane protein YtjA (UPF0391 family)
VFPSATRRHLAARELPPFEGKPMLRAAVAFLVIALLAALFGFGGVAGVSMDAAKLLFVVFLVLAVISFLGGAFRGNSRVPV